jgi:hypothetical protein
LRATPCDSKARCTGRALAVRRRTLACHCSGLSGIKNGTDDGAAAETFPTLARLLGAGHAQGHRSPADEAARQLSLGQFQYFGRTHESCSAIPETASRPHPIPFAADKLPRRRPNIRPALPGHDWICLCLHTLLPGTDASKVVSPGQSLPGRHKTSAVHLVQPAGPVVPSTNGRHGLPPRTAKILVDAGPVIHRYSLNGTIPDRGVRQMVCPLRLGEVIAGKD